MVHMKVHVSIKDRDHFVQQTNQIRSHLFSASRAYDKEPLACAAFLALAVLRGMMQVILLGRNCWEKEKAPVRSGSRNRGDDGSDGGSGGGGGGSAPRNVSTAW